jgi:hypothetical protein
MKASRAPRRADAPVTMSTPAQPATGAQALQVPMRTPRFIGASDAVPATACTVPADVRRDALSPFKLDRRRAPREPAAGILSATYTNGTSRHGIAQLHVLDRGPRGLGAFTTSRIEAGMHVTLAPAGSSVAWLSGRAVRCEPAMCEGGEEGWHIGIEFAPAYKAAA